jgi:hypothetical protein
MTDEECQKLIARFRAHEVFMWTDIDLAADEIERLITEVRQLERDLQWIRERYAMTEYANYD